MEAQVKKKHHSFSKEHKELYAKIFANVERIAKEKGITLYRISRDLRLSSGFASNWRQGKESPKLEKLIAIANYLDVDIKEVIC